MRTRSHQPVRTCAGCGARALQRELVRLQADAEGWIAPVATHVRGRSAYVHKRSECVERLVRSRLLARSLRVTIGAVVRQQAVARLRDELCDATRHGQETSVRIDG